MVSKDFNLVLDTLLSKISEESKELQSHIVLQEFNLVDVWRLLSPNTQQCTCFIYPAWQIFKTGLFLICCLIVNNVTVFE